MTFGRVGGKSHRENMGGAISVNQLIPVFSFSIDCCYSYKLQYIDLLIGQSLASRHNRGQNSPCPRVRAIGSELGVTRSHMLEAVYS